VCAIEDCVSCHDFQLTRYRHVNRALCSCGSKIDDAFGNAGLFKNVESTRI